MAFEIKLLQPADRPLLDRVADDLFDEAIDLRLAGEFLGDPRHHLVAAIEEGEVVGFASAVHYVHPDKPAQLWINEVGVAPSHQGRGIGKAVMRAMLEHGERLGCAEGWVLTDSSNAAAMRLYASAGGKQAPGDTVMFEFALDASRAEESGHRWYARPVFFVADIQRSIRFYVDSLGFRKDWHEADGAGTVCQVSRSDCEIILCQDARRPERARLFVELSAEGLADFRRELEARAVPHSTTWWGYDTTQVNDPDGNELFFPVPD